MYRLTWLDSRQRWPSVQPFWALPLLAIARLRIRDIMGFTTITLLVTGVVFAATIMLPALG